MIPFRLFLPAEQPLIFEMEGSGMQNKIFTEDMEYILHDPCVSWEQLSGAKLLVTGATGLICSTLVKAVLYANQKRGLNCEIWCLVRDVRKAEKLFADELPDPALHFVSASVEADTEFPVQFDYIIHGASPTASSFFVEHPVETIRTAICGTQNMLETAKQHQAKGFVYLSSMEAYGHVTDERVLTEDDLGTIALSNIRNSYPESKRICELLCRSYASEYGMRAMSIRLAQTFGPGVLRDDKRVFAMMARCAMSGEDIVLLTKGKSKHPYLYTAQAVTAILCVLFSGDAGETYNAANPKTDCSIYEMGEKVAAEIAGGTIRVRVAESDEVPSKYPPAGYLNLSIEKLSRLNWKPGGTLADMYVRMMECMQNDS